MQKIKSIIRSKWLIIPLVIISLWLNIVYLINENSPVRFTTTVGSMVPYDREDTVYLAHGVVAFKNKIDQPKNTLQIMTFYVDTSSTKVYVDESYVMNNVLTFMGRNEMEIVSYDKATKIITLKGNGWDKVIIDAEKKQLIEATDTTGDVVYLKSTWEIR